MPATSRAAPTTSGAVPATSRPCQFSIRALFVLTTVLAAFYASLASLGFFAHVAVWGIFLVGGPILGTILGVRHLREADPIVNSVQAGALGGTLGFAGALLLLAPSYTASQAETILLGALFGVLAAFAAGGLLGLFIGGCRLLWQMAVGPGELPATIPPPANAATPRPADE